MNVIDFDYEMAPRKMSEELEVRLVYEVQKRPILWDISLDSYRRTDLKQPLWEEIAANLGPQYSGKEAAARFKNIKDTFSQNVRKVRESHRSGADSADIYKPKWHLWKLCQFMLKSCDQAESTSNIPTTKEAEVVQNSLESSNSILQTELLNCTNSEVNNSVYYDDTLKKFMVVPPDPSPVPSDGDELHNIFSPSSGSGPASPEVSVVPRPASAPVQVAPHSSKSSPYSSSQTTSMFESKGSKKRNYDAMKDAVDIMKDIARQPVFPPGLLPPPPPPETPHDEHDMFSKFVASRLRRMEKEKALECENKLMEVLISFK